MLLLVTIGLVVVGAVSLVIGFVQNSLPPIYVSIVCSLLAAAVLVVFSRLSRRQAATVAVGGGVPLGGARGAPAAAPARAPEVAEELTVVPSPPRREAAFPIADYDDLKVAEILPLLEELDDEELHQVLDREQGDRDRATIVRRVEELLRPTVVVLGARGRDDEPAGEPVGAGEEDDVVFPIADYDELRIGEILPLLPELDDVELVMVREREVGGRNRTSVLRGIADLLGEPAPVNEAPKRAPAKKAVPKKAAATKAAGSSRSAAKSTGAKGGGTRKAAGKAAPAKSAAKSTKAGSSTKATKATKSTPRKRSPR